jgi:hypothetical protein
MTEGWANFDAVGSGDVFHALHAGLTVELISTKRLQLMTCTPHETLAVVMARNTEPYDFLPVLVPGDGQQGQIVGLFHAARFFDETPTEGRVERHYAPLSEEYLIGADALSSPGPTSSDWSACPTSRNCLSGRPSLP